MNFFKKQISPDNFKRFIEVKDRYTQGKNHYKLYHYKTHLTEDIDDLDVKTANAIFAVRGITLKNSKQGFIEFTKTFPTPLIKYETPSANGKYSKYYEGTLLTIRKMPNGQPLISTHRKLNIKDSKFMSHKKTFKQMLEDLLSDPEINSAYNTLMDTYKDHCFAFLVVHEDNQLTMRTFDGRKLLLVGAYKQNKDKLEDDYKKVSSTTDKIILAERFNKKKARKLFEKQIPVVYYGYNLPKTGPINYYPETYDEALHLRNPECATIFKRFYELDHETQYLFKELLPKIYEEVEVINSRKREECRQFQAIAITVFNSFFEYIESNLVDDLDNSRPKIENIYSVLRLSEKKRIEGMKKLKADDWIKQIKNTTEYRDLLTFNRNVNVDFLLKELYLRVPPIMYSFLFEYLENPIVLENRIKNIDVEMLKVEINKINNFVKFVKNKNDTITTVEQ